MAFNGSGTFVRLYNWVADAALGTKIRADKMDGEMDGFATGLTNTITRDGQSTTTARIPLAAGLQLNVGAVGAPSINFAADSDTGTYSPGSDQWAVTAGGIQRFLVNAGAISVTGTFAVSSDFAVATSKFTVAAASGNTIVGGTLGVTAAATLTDNLSVGGAITLTGAQTIGSTLTVTGATALNGGLSTTTISGSGNVAINTNKFNINATTGAFTAAGAGVISGTLNVTGAATLAAGSTMGGNAITNFPAGTAMIFQQTAAPTGWTKSTTHNDKALRIVSGAASSGGSTAFTTVFAARTIAQSNLPNATLSATPNTASQTLAHQQSGNSAFSTSSASTGTLVSTSTANVNVYQTSQSAAITDHTVSFPNYTTASMNGGVVQTNMDFAVQYVDVIIATKD
jgi:hypothetical protein